MKENERGKNETEKKNYIPSRKKENSGNYYIPSRKIMGIGNVM